MNLKDTDTLQWYVRPNKEIYLDFTLILPRKLWRNNETKIYADIYVRQQLEWPALQYLEGTIDNADPHATGGLEYLTLYFDNSGELYLGNHTYYIDSYHYMSVLMQAMWYLDQVVNPT